MRFLAKAGSEQIKVHVRLKRFCLDRILVTMQPLKVAVIACLAARDKAMVEGLDRWFAHLSLPELVPSWFKKDQIGGRVGLPAVDSQWFGSGINRAGESLLTFLIISVHSNSVRCLPSRQPSSGGGGRGAYEVVLAITNTFEVRHRYSYRGVLTMLMDNLWHDGGMNMRS